MDNLKPVQGRSQLQTNWIKKQIKEGTYKEMADGICISPECSEESESDDSDVEVESSTDKLTTSKSETRSKFPTVEIEDVDEDEEVYEDAKELPNPLPQDSPNLLEEVNVETEGEVATEVSKDTSVQPDSPLSGINIEQIESLHESSEIDHMAGPSVIIDPHPSDGKTTLNEENIESQSELLLPQVERVDELPREVSPEIQQDEVISGNEANISDDDSSSVNSDLQEELTDEQESSCDEEVEIQTENVPTSGLSEKENDDVEVEQFVDADPGFQDGPLKPLEVIEQHTVNEELVPDEEVIEEPSIPPVIERRQTRSQTRKQDNS